MVSLSFFFGLEVVATLVLVRPNGLGLDEDSHVDGRIRRDEKNNNTGNVRKNLILSINQWLMVVGCWLLVVDMY